MGGCTALGESLRINKTLKALNLENNEQIGIISEACGLMAFAPFAPKCCWQRSIGAETLAAALQVNAKLEVLNLARTGLSDGSAEAVANMLRVNTTLTVLNLSGNEIWND